MSTPIALRHGRVTLALHLLRPGEGRALLLLHALNGSASDWQGGADGIAGAWPGPVYALDFSGHGGSDWVAGGGYTPELLAGDADVALARVGAACIVGAGIGAWAALLLAGARPDDVPGALLLPGRGLSGGGALPDPASTVPVEWMHVSDARLAQPGRVANDGTSDPLLFQLERDLRPVDYAEAFAARARRLVLVADASPPPAWWEAVAQSKSAQRIGPGEVAEALETLAAD